jgi:O-antigen/teichoic acid export membrane protein
MRLSWNLLAGLSNSAWTAIVGLAATPFYLRYLGLDAYGLIGFFTSLLVLLQLLDFGLSPAMNREVARQGAGAGLRNLLRSLENIYWAIALLLGGLMIATAGWIGRHWLQSSHLTRPDIVHAVMLMGLVVAARWSTGLYLGVLMGAQRQVAASAITIAVTTLTAVGAVLVLAFLSATIHAFFIWQAGMGLVYALVMRWSAWRALGGSQGARFDLGALREVWRFSAGLTGVAISGVILSQLDKVLLSRLLGLDAFGRYMLATMVASGLYLLVTPVFNAIYPRFSVFVASGETERLAELYGLGTRLLATLLFPMAMGIALNAQSLMQLWTRDPAIASSAAPVVSILVIGSAIHGVMYFPYALQLASGALRLPLTINAFLIALIVPLIVFLTLAFAEVGAAIAWLSLHVCYLFLGTWLTHRRLLRGRGTAWLLRDVGIPVLATLIVALVASRIAMPDGAGPAGGLLRAAVVSLSAALLSLALSPGLRDVLYGNLVLLAGRKR